MPDEELIKLLVGRKIVSIRRMTDALAEEYGLDCEHDNLPLDIILEGSEDHGSIRLCALADTEGNNGGVMIARIGRDQFYLDHAVQNALFPVFVE